jgi:hypothetical protein
MRGVTAVLAALLGLLVSTANDATTRSSSAKAAFKRANPCPATGKAFGLCGGYVIDHIVPLACGGADTPGNMQWQTISAAKAKDRWELNCILWLPQ